MNWGLQVLYYHNEAGNLVSIPASWTDFSEKDPFVEQSAGRCYFRFADMKELAVMLEQLSDRMAHDADKKVSS